MFRLTRSVICVAVVASMAVISCNDSDNPSGPSFNKADLVGSWTLTKEIYTEKGQQPETETINNEFIYKYTEDNKLISYYSSKEENCTGIYTVLNALDGDKISGAEGDMTISIQGNELIMTYSDSDYSSTSYFTKYSGALPPASWPTAKCSEDDYGLLKKHINKN